MTSIRVDLNANANSGPRDSFGEWRASTLPFALCVLMADILLSPPTTYWIGRIVVTKHSDSSSAKLIALFDSSTSRDDSHIDEYVSVSRVRWADAHKPAMKSYRARSRVRCAAARALQRFGPGEPAVGPRRCCVLMACILVVLGSMSRCDTYIKSSRAYDQTTKPRFWHPWAFEV